MMRGKKMMILALAVCLLGTMFGCAKNKESENEMKQISRGLIEGNVYTSEFVGLKFTKPELWVYSTDEEIAAVMQVGADVLGSDKFSTEVASLTTIYDMMVRDALTGNNISVMFENLKVSGMSNMTEEQYIATFKELMKEQAAMMNYKFYEADQAKLGDQTYSRVKAEGSYMNVGFEQYMYVRKESTYMIVITVSVFDGTSSSEYEAMFGGI